MQEMQFQSIGSEDPWRRKWQPTLVYLLRNPMGRRAGHATVHEVTKGGEHDLATKQQQ